MSSGNIDSVDLVGDLSLMVFRLNGRLTEAGDELMADLGLTSSWWRVLGVIDLSPTPLPVPHIARQVGLTRQAVQRIVNLLEAEGLIRFEPNPHHARAKLVVLTEAAHTVLEAVHRRYQPWSEAIARAIPPERLFAALEVLAELELYLANTADQRNGDADEVILT